MNSAIRGTELSDSGYETCVPQKKRKELGVAALRTVSQSVYYTQQEWQLVQYAASLEGISRSEFVAIAAVRRAQETIQRHSIIQSSPAQSARETGLETTNSIGE